MVALHPVLAARDEAFRADPRLRGLVTVNNTVRTRGEQIILWEGYQAKLEWAAKHPWLPAIMNPYRHYNTAANPYAVYDGAYDVEARFGSWHMEQFSTKYQGYFGYAIDYNYSILPRDIKNIFISVASEYMLIETVFTPQYEPWHYQMTWTDWEWTPSPIQIPTKEWYEDMNAEDREEVKELVREVLLEHNTQARIDAVHAEVTKLTRSGKPTMKAKIDNIDKEVRGEEGRTLNKLLEANNRWTRAVAKFLGVELDK